MNYQNRKTSEIRFFQNKMGFDVFFILFAKNNKEEYNEELMLRGNNGFKLKHFRAIAEKVGYENVGIEYYDTFQDFLDTIYIRPINDCEFSLNFADDIRWQNGLLKLWFD